MALENTAILKRDRAKVFGFAAVGGFVATLAIVALILVGEAVMAYPRGFFYTVMGNAFGANGDDAMMLGFYLHLLAGTLIGVIAASPIAAMKRLYIFMDNILKRLLYGAVAGSLIWVLFFIPISYIQVAGAIESIGDGFLDVSGKVVKAEEVSSKFTNIVITALGFHIQYGLVYAVITGAFINRRIRILMNE